MHPSSEVEREYLVRLRGRPGAEVIRQLLGGIPLEDGPARFDRIEAWEAENEDAAGSHSTYRVVLHEGRNREVRRLWNAVGFEVSRLLRIRYGPVELPRDMRPGTTRPVVGELLEGLRACRRSQGRRPGTGKACPGRVCPAPACPGPPQGQGPTPAPAPP